MLSACLSSFISRRPPGRHEGGGARRVEVEVSGFSVRAERYNERDSHAWRLAVSVHDFEVRHSGDSSWLCAQGRRLAAHLIALSHVARESITNTFCRYEHPCWQKHADRYQRWAV